MPASSISHSTSASLRAAILFAAPAVMLVGHAAHPWIGNPTDADFFARLATAVERDPSRWAFSHFLVAVGSGLLVLAFLAIRAHVRERGEDRWSLLGVPFIVMGCVFYAMLPAMEAAPLAAVAAGADAAAIQAAMMRWFSPLLVASAVLVAAGILAFVTAIQRSHLMSPRTRWIAIGALLVLAITRFLPVGAAQLYIGPLAAVVGLWPIGYAIWKSQPRTAGQLRPAPV